MNAVPPTPHAPAAARPHGPAAPGVLDAPAVATSTSLLGALFDGALDGIMILDDHGRVVDVNATACEMLGAARADLLGASALARTADLAEGHPAWHELLGAGTRTGEIRLLDDRGDERYLEYRARANVMPGLHLTVMRDVTEQRAAHQRLRSSEALFATAFHRSPIPKAIAETAGGPILDINAAAAALTGYTREQMIGKTALELGLWPDPTHYARQATAFATGGVEQLPTVLRRADGSVRDIESWVERIEVNGRKCLLGVYVDVTETTRARQQLVESQWLLEQSQAVSRIGSWASGLEPSSPQQWSSELYRLLAVPPDRTVTLGDFIAMVHPGDRARVFDPGATTPREVEFRVIRGDGETRWMQASLDHRHDAAGAVVGVLGTLQDITERKCAEDARRASDDRYRRIIEASPEGIVILSPDHRIAMANRRLAELVGSSVEELIGQPVTAFVPARVHARLAAVLDAHATGDATYDLPLLHRDGRERIVAVSASALIDADGGYEGFLGVISDVTERRELEQARDQLAAIVQSASEAIISADLAGRLLSWNGAAERLFGIAATEVLGTVPVGLVPRERVAESRAAHERALAGERVSFETARRHKDGHELDLQITYSRLVDASGRVLGVSSIARDISERKRLEQSLRDAESQVRQLQKMEAIGGLAGGIAHDFNNLLFVILTCSSLLEEMLPAGDPAADEVAQIREAGERAAHLTRQLLAFSRKQLLAAQVVKLDEVVLGMEDMLRRVVGEAVVLEVVPEPGLGNVLVDPNQFEQVILNLAVNARDAMPEGGTLAITHRDVALGDVEAAAIPGARPGSYVCVTVTDTGTGMDAATRERMFEPFFTTKEKGRGTGLGLSTVFGIVRQSGGHIVVRSAPGDGATFEVYLPRTDRTPLAVTQPSGEVASRPAPRETILLVEDEELVRRAAYTTLRRLGYKVLVAANAGEALLLAEQHAIDLLLTDLVMPIMNGKQLADRLPRERPGLRVVLMSGHSADVVDGDELARRGMAFVQKPVRPAVMAAKLREVLDAH